MNDICGTIFAVKRFPVHDGPGIRTTVFLQGCCMRCAWCHNPESWSKTPVPLAKKNVSAQVRTAAQVMEEIEKDRIFYEESGGGVTFSGGEPLEQHEFLNRLLEKCHAVGLHTTLDTCGWASSEIFSSVIAHVDLFLYDLKMMDDQLHRRWTGVSNTPVLENLKILANFGKSIFLRIPVIPGINDDLENIRQTACFINTLPGHAIKELHLLPYHSSAKAKYQRLGKVYPLAHLQSPGQEKMEALAQIFSEHLKDKDILIKDGG